MKCTHFDIDIFCNPKWTRIERSTSFSVIHVGVKSGRESLFHKEKCIRLMLAPRSAKAKHSAFPGKSHGIKNLPGSPSFSGNFFRRTAEQCSFSGVLANLQSLFLIEVLKLGLGALIGEITGSMVGELTGSEVKIRDLDWTTGGWTSSVLQLLVGCTVSLVASGLFSTTLGRKEGGGRVPELEVEALLEFTNLGLINRLKNPPLKHPVFEEPELDKQELGKLVVGKPEVDKQEREENQVVKFDLTSSEDDSWYFLGCS
nr:hypothetical protein [Tanacetum cinerariifolium]